MIWPLVGGIPGLGSRKPALWRSFLGVERALDRATGFRGRFHVVEHHAAECSTPLHHLDRIGVPAVGSGLTAGIVADDDEEPGADDAAQHAERDA